MSKVVLITGVSAGFGRHTATLLAQKGYKVYGTCRSDCEHDPLVQVIKMDVTDVQAVRNGINTILEREGRIDILINNAGVHTGGAIEVYPYEDIKLQMDTNFMGVIHTIKAVLPAMRGQGSGTIINISSIGGLMGLPFMGYYSACKFALEGLSEALRMELRQFNIRVIVINPGDFRTKNTATRKNIFADHNVDAYEQQFRKTLKIIELEENNGWHPEILARKIYRIVEKKKPASRYIVGSWKQKTAVRLKYLIPEPWFEAILRNHYDIR
jgi:NAD(P)-dependent dehydrogenase (short-subunit alcohol dehydrogenase family)